MLPHRITRGIQNLHRARQIASVLSQHGFGHVVERLDLHRLLPTGLRRETTGELDSAPMSTGRRLCQVASELGPIFVKLGQTLAARPDLIPEDILVELQNLHDDVAPFDTTVAQEMIVEELGMPLDESYAAIETEPFASGSIGQVYRATLHDERRVVVKVRRPGIDKTVQSDLQLLKVLAEGLEAWVPESKPYHPTAIVEEFEQTLLRELDYPQEAATTARIHEAFEDDPHVEIPEVIWSHCTENVLTLEALDGVHLQRAIESGAAGLDRKELATHLADAFLRQIFEIRTFHADPHPGNMLIRAPSTIGIIDFGQIGIIGDEFSNALLFILMGAVNRDMTVVRDALHMMDAITGETDEKRLARDLQTLVDKYHGQPAHRLKTTTIFIELTDMIRRHHVAVPRDVVLMIKSLATAWGAALSLDPELDLVALIRPRMSSMVRSRLSPRRALRAGGMSAFHLTNLLRHGPQQLQDLLRQISSGSWQFSIRHENLDKLGRELDTSSNRLSFSIVIAGIVVGSSVVVSSDPGVHVLGVRLQTFGVIGYLVAAILGLGLLWAIFRSGRLS